MAALGKLRIALRDNGLVLAMASACLLSLLGMVASGWSAENEVRAEHGAAPLALAGYLQSGQFREALFENWESEFLQMAMYVVLTVWLFQRGSSESKDPDRPAPQDADPRLESVTATTPWPVRRGGWWLVVYENSLLLLFAGLFLASFWAHVVGGAANFNAEADWHGQDRVSAWEFLGTSEFWFQSTQNWQSEFMVMAVLVIAATYLRQRGSPESKPVAAPHRETGND
ncbi:MAG: DUF6766 family protein [Agromyces sp.]